MLESLLAPKWIILCVFVASAIYVHYRGRVRHGFFRQLTDHSSVIAPYNVLMYAFSAVPNKPYIDVAAFPELAPLREHWETIRDEGLALFESGHIRAAAKYNDIGFHSLFRGGYTRFYVKWYDDPPPSAKRASPSSRIVSQCSRSGASSGTAATSMYGSFGTAENAYISTLYGAITDEWSVSWRKKPCRTRPR